MSKFVGYASFGVVSLGAISTGTYKIWDWKNPPGSRWLENNGFDFSEPKFTSHARLDHGCSENIFKEDPGFNNEQVYGCGVARMDLWDSDNQFKDNQQYSKINYIAFNSEISIRKGDQGWKINTKFNNQHETVFVYQHLLTTYKKENKEWKEKEIVRIEPTYSLSTKQEISLKKDSERFDPKLIISNQKINIDLPNQKDPWIQDNHYVMSYPQKSSSDGNLSDERLTKVYKGSKYWSGIWIGNSGENSWIFQGINIFIGDKKYSQIFCKETETEDSSNCRQQLDSTGTSVYKEGKENTYGQTVKGTKDIEGTWDYMRDKYLKNQRNTQISNTVQPILTAIQDSKGKWVDTKEICGTVESRYLTEDQKRDLQMFCSKPKK